MIRTPTSILNSAMLAAKSSVALPKRRALKQSAAIGSMDNLLNIPKAQSTLVTPNCISAATEEGRMLSGKEVAAMFGYKNRASFWSFCAREGVPICRLSSHTIRFPAAALKAWLQKRSNTGCIL
jgi:hypothetical protein